MLRVIRHIPDLAEFTPGYTAQENTRRQDLRAELQERAQRRAHDSVLMTDNTPQGVQQTFMAVASRLAELERFVDTHFPSPLNPDALAKLQNAPPVTPQEVQQAYDSQYGGPDSPCYRSSLSSSHGSVVDKVFNDYCKPKISRR